MSDEPPLCVRRYDGPGRFLVRSEQPGSEQWYLCDLSEPAFPNGKCTCTHYAVRIEHPMSHDEKPIESQCKHLRRCRAELQHAEDLCALAGIPFDPRIIPTL